MALLFLLCALAKFLLLTNGQLEASSNGVFRARVGEEFMINCSCAEHSDMQFQIVWYFNNIPLCQPGAGEHETCHHLSNVIIGSCILHFRSLSLEQAGWYTCATYNRTTFDREERDFLLIVQEPPTLITSFMRDYVTSEGSRVELPCAVMRGHPFPDTIWQVNGQNLSQHPDLPYNVDRFTRSLILLNVTTDNVEDRTFRCIASNSAGTIASENFTVNVNENTDYLQFNSNFSPLIGNQSALYYVRNESRTETFECTNLTSSELDAKNLSVEWWKNSDSIGEMNEIAVNLAANSSGFYCCQVLDDVGAAVSTVCASLVVLGTTVDFTPPPTIVTLPSKGSRTANILCQSRASTNMPLNFTWTTGSGQPLMEGGELGLEFSSDSQSLSYVQADIPNNSTSMSVSCIANRTAGGMVETKSATIAISVVDICSGSNSLRSPGIDFEDITADAWDSRGGGEYFREVYSEKVFVANGSDSRIRQEVTITGYQFSISGRMRGQAEIRILLDGSDIMAVFPADPSSGAWEWFGLQYELNSTYLALGTLTVELQTGGDAGIGYFDDLCVSFSRPFLASKATIIAAWLGAVCVVLALLIALVIIRYFSCKRKYQQQQQRKRQDAVLMSKVTTTLLNKWKRPESIAVCGAKSKEENTITSEPIYNIASPAEELPSVVEQENDVDEDDEDDYVNEGLVIVHSPPSISVDNSRSQASLSNSVSQGNPSNSAHLLSPKRVIDFGEGDFTFVDPKSLFPKRHDVSHSRSTSNMNMDQMPKTEQTLRRSEISKSMGNLETSSATAECYVSNEAMRKKNTPSNLSQGPSRGRPF